MDTLQLSALRTDGGTQPRASINAIVVEEYAEAMRCGDEFPPLRAKYDGENYWLYDGFHRLKAAKQCGRETIEVAIEQGTQRDAQWASLAANKDHGLRRNEADKERAIKKALRDFPEKSNAKIGEHVGCHRHTVRKYRHELEQTCTNYTSSPKRKVKTSDGREYEVDTSNIGGSKKKRKKKPKQLTGNAPKAPPKQQGKREEKPKTPSKVVNADDVLHDVGLMILNLASSKKYRTKIDELIRLSENGALTYEQRRDLAYDLRHAAQVLTKDANKLFSEYAVYEVTETVTPKGEEEGL